ncbi:hypothetical protein SAVIM40S_01535 [Streptomyces avidinii]
MIERMRALMAALGNRNHGGTVVITDPELGEEWKTEAMEQASAPSGSAREPTAGGPGPRPWKWALGGAVVASAVWAGGLYAVGGPPGAPEISYRASVEVSAFTFGERHGRPATDADAVKAAMAEDLRELIAALRK